VRYGVNDQRYSRRGVLRAATTVAGAVATVPLAGCGLFDREEPEDPDPLDPLLGATVRLGAEYDAAIASQPELAERLTPLRDAHKAHAKALAQVIGRPASRLSPSPAGNAAGSPAAGDAAATLAQLRAAEKAGQDEAAAACLAAPPERAAVLGSITAARATHQEVLE
jgi:hypothetical protein